MSENKSKVEASLELSFRDKETARSILEAISPDNIKLPEGIKISSCLKDSILLLKISCSRGVGSLTATLDDVLSCIQAAEKTLSQLDKN